MAAFLPMLASVATKVAPAAAGAAKAASGAAGALKAAGGAAKAAGAAAKAAGAAGSAGKAAGGGATKFAENLSQRTGQVNLPRGGQITSTSGLMDWEKPEGGAVAKGVSGARPGASFADKAPAPVKATGGVGLGALSGSGPPVGAQKAIDTYKTAESSTAGVVPKQSFGARFRHGAGEYLKGLGREELKQLGPLSGGMGQKPSGSAAQDMSEGKGDQQKKPQQEKEKEKPPDYRTHFAADLSGKPYDTYADPDIGSSQKAPNIQGSRKKGGPIRKTGLYLLHKNEYVVPANKRRSGKAASHKKTVIKA